jgi:hypothetical protein
MAEKKEITPTRRKDGKLEPGISLNPAGRKYGSKNKMTTLIKEKMEAVFNEPDLDLIADIKSISKPEIRVRYMLEIAKHLVPRPIADDNATAEQIRSEFIRRLINGDDNNE